MTQHERFLQRLMDSSRAVFAVAQHLHTRGQMVEVGPLRMAPTAAEHESFVDGGDLFVVTKHRYEVKHIGVNFTCRTDWPFAEVFVSNVEAVDRAGDQVAAYISVSRDMTHAAVVTRGTRKHWFNKTVRAKNTGNVETYYACPLDLVEFKRLMA